MGHYSSVLESILVAVLIGAASLASPRASAFAGGPGQAENGPGRPRECTDSLEGEYVQETFRIEYSAHLLCYAPRRIGRVSVSLTVERCYQSECVTHVAERSCSPHQLCSVDLSVPHSWLEAEAEYRGSGTFRASRRPRIAGSLVFDARCSTLVACRSTATQGSTQSSPKLVLSTTR